MAGKKRRHNPVPVSDLVSRIIDPVLARRTGVTTSLLQAWDEIVGSELARQSRPERIKWNRRAGDDDPFEPATLIIACEAMAALHVQHRTSEIMSRINGFLGYSAIGRIKIVQKSIGAEKPIKSAPRVLPDAQMREIAKKVSGVEDEELRKALERLGKNVAASR